MLLCLLRLLCLLQTDAEVTTEKFGLEAGLWKVWSSKNAEGQTKGDQVRGPACAAGSLAWWHVVTARSVNLHFVALRSVNIYLPCCSQLVPGVHLSSRDCISLGVLGWQTLNHLLRSTDLPPLPTILPQAKDLLKRYGSAYLITSISFALVSMAACYLAVDAGLDVAGLLARLGLQVRLVA